MLDHLTAYFTDHGLPVEDFSLRLHAPGRINLIGEHLDYNGGLVMPASIDKGLQFFARQLDAPQLRLHAVDLNETHTLELPQLEKTGITWVDYLVGIARKFQQLGKTIPGLEIVFGGNLPAGAGMSSSAALEGGMAFLLNELTQSGLSRPALAQLCQRSSNNFMGIPSGIMDQFASLNGTADGPMLLDCDRLEFRPIVNRIKGYSFMLVNSMVSHSLASGEYHVRVRECAAALAAIQTRFPSVANLSTATREQLDSVAEKLDEKPLLRARYVIAENARVQAALRALEAGDGPEFGRLLNSTHAGLRDEYEVSCPEVDFLQERAVASGLVAGARIMGGGFGGCTINLVRAGREAKLGELLTAAYREAYQLTPECYRANIGSGTYLMS
ncbi:galactokinase [Lewinella sp. W8]|uniref:galactokinase n=1 Tax=Lewinella sp. W8 TaxID=2528208 RepID=UPI001068AC24|nr:galactokinase [Lewinella sp. W8]MTB53844.1 galactokinase [Lewinella sp. W8]